MYTVSYQTQKINIKYLQTGSQWQDRFLKTAQLQQQYTGSYRNTDKKTNTNNS